MQTENIKILVIEDEDIWVLGMKNFLHSLGFEISGIATNVADAITLINENNFDVALLDIHIDKKNSGIDLGILINNSVKKPFIFVTANTDHYSIQEITSAKPSAYLTKPTDKNALFVAIHNAIKNFTVNEGISVGSFNVENESDSFFVKTGNKYKRIFWKNIVTLSADEKYVLIELDIDSSAYYIRSSLQNAIKNIVPSQYKSLFYQVNKSQYININHVSEINGSYIATESKRIISVSENYISKLKEAVRIIS